MSAFFEPHDHEGNKYPFVFKPKENDFLSLAGIYTRIENKVTFAILTLEASPLFARIHNKKNRQHVIFNEEQVSQRLNEDLKESKIQTLLQTHYDENQLEHYPVSGDLFSPKVNSDVEEIMEKVDNEELEV